MYLFLKAAPSPEFPVSEMGSIIHLTPPAHPRNYPVG